MLMDRVTEMSESQLNKIKKGDFVLNVSDLGPKASGFIILTFTLGLFVYWSVQAPLDSAALAPGSVVVDGYRKTVQHLEGGIVKTIDVNDGDNVQKDDVLITLDDTLAKSELGITQGQIYALEATKARLEAERDQSNQIDFSDLTAPQDSRTLDAISNEKAVFNARNAANQGQVDVLTKRIAQLDEQIAGLKSTIKNRTTLVESFKSEILELRELLNDGFVDIQRIRELERRKAELETSIAEANSSIAQINVRKGETELQIAQLQKEIKTEVVNQLTQLEIKLSDLLERQRALKSRLDRTVIKAPESGMVMALNAHTIGGVIRGGEPILEIVPTDTELVIEAQVTPVDIDRVSIGMVAEVRFSAFKQSITPTIDGQVVSISADRLVDPNNGLPYYLAKIRLPEDEKAKLGKLQLVAGMPAEVLIKTGERTVFEYLIQPATDAVARSMIED